jgi:hypothetical protein
MNLPSVASGGFFSSAFAVMEIALSRANKGCLGAKWMAQRLRLINRKHKQKG